MRNPGPENANSFRQKEAVVGTTMLRWASGNETCPAGLRQAESVVGVGFESINQNHSIAPGHFRLRVPVIRCRRHASRQAETALF